MHPQTHARPSNTRTLGCVFEGRKKVSDVWHYGTTMKPFGLPDRLTAQTLTFASQQTPSSVAETASGGTRRFQSMRHKRAPFCVQIIHDLPRRRELAGGCFVPSRVTHHHPLSPPSRCARHMCAHAVCDRAWACVANAPEPRLARRMSVLTRVARRPLAACVCVMCLTPSQRAGAPL